MEPRDVDDLINTEDEQLKKLHEIVTQTKKN